MYIPLFRTLKAYQSFPPTPITTYWYSTLYFKVRPRLLCRLNYHPGLKLVSIIVVELYQRFFAFRSLIGRLRIVRKALGIDKSLTTHIFRYSHVSKLAGLGAPLYIIQNRVGHADSETTRDIYLHVTQTVKGK